MQVLCFEMQNYEISSLRYLGWYMQRCQPLRFGRNHYDLGGVFTIIRFAWPLLRFGLSFIFKSVFIVFRVKVRYFGLWFWYDWRHFLLLQNRSFVLVKTRAVIGQYRCYLHQSALMKHLYVFAQEPITAFQSQR